MINDFRKIPSWIDLEFEVEKVLEKFSYIFQACENNIHNEKSKQYLYDLKQFNIFISKQENREFSWGYNWDGDHKGYGKYPITKTFLNPEYCSERGGVDRIDVQVSLSYLYAELESFIDIFDDYITLIVDKLLPKNMPKIEWEIFDFLAEIYSFNYTNTFMNFYNNKWIKHLHGAIGHKPNNKIVLGVDSFDDAFLNKHGAHKFTKIFQRMSKESELGYFDNDIKNLIDEIATGVSGLETNIFIWGHSLGKSDKSYIQKIFEYNKIADNLVRLTIYVHIDHVDVLEKLCLIIDSQVVMNWKKNGWLRFEKNPHINFHINEESVTE